MESLEGTPGNESDLQCQEGPCSLSFLCCHSKTSPTLVTISPDSLCVPWLPRGIIVQKQEVWERTHLPGSGPTSPERALEESPCEIIHHPHTKAPWGLVWALRTGVRRGADPHLLPPEALYPLKLLIPGVSWNQDLGNDGIPPLIFPPKLTEAEKDSEGPAHGASCHSHQCSDNV